MGLGLGLGLGLGIGVGVGFTFSLKPKECHHARGDGLPFQSTRSACSSVRGQG